MFSIGVIGVNHKTADLSLREEIGKLGSALKNNPFFPIVLLTTCNRVEIYFSAPNLAQAHSQLLSFFRKFEQFFYSFFGADCFFHLCKVASGLDSAIIAESEIQRQVKLAYASASYLPSCMHYVFQKALKISKEIRSKQQMNSHALYHAIWKLTDWENRSILIVGFSQINRGLIAFLKRKKMGHLTLCTRANIRPEGVEVGGRELLEKWPDYDIVIAASKSDSYLIRGKGSSTIFDLGVPRNVDPEVEATLFNIEQIQSKIDQIEPIDESVIWRHVIHLSSLYRLKSQRVPDSEEMELHL